MKRSVVVPICLLAMVALATAADARRSRDLSETIPWSEGQAVRLDFPVGELRVEATSDNEVTVDIHARCRKASDCEKGLESLHIETDSSGRVLEVDVDAPRPWRKLKIEMEATIRVPRGASLTVDMGIGDLKVDGFENDLRVDLGIGEVSVRVPEQTVESLSVDAGIGEASLHGTERSGESAGLFVKTVRWDDGPGDARVRVEVGIGEASVWMD